jgi:hypothetical protein
MEKIASVICPPIVTHNAISLSLSGYQGSNPGFGPPAGVQHHGGLQPSQSQEVSGLSNRSVCSHVWCSIQPLCPMVTNPAESAYFPKVTSNLLSLYWTEDTAYILMRYRSILVMNTECSSQFRHFCVPYSVYTIRIKGFLSAC